MTGRVQALRSNVSGSRPTGRQPGEIYVNWADGQIGVINSSNGAQDFVAVKFQHHCELQYWRFRHSGWAALPGNRRLSCRGVRSGELGADWRLSWHWGCAIQSTTRHIVVG